MNGVDLIILANTGTPEVPAYTFVGGQRSATINESSETNDLSVKPSDGSRPAKSYDYGYYNATISCDGLYVPTDAAYQTLKDAIRGGTKLKVQWEESTTATLEANVLVTTHNIEGPYDGEATYSVEMQVDGLPTELP